MTRKQHERGSTAHYCDLFARCSVASFPKGDFGKAGDATTFVVRCRARLRDVCCAERLFCTALAAARNGAAQRMRQKRGTREACISPAASCLPAGPRDWTGCGPSGWLCARSKQPAATTAPARQPGRLRPLPVPAAPLGGGPPLRHSRRLHRGRPQPAPRVRQQPVRLGAGGAHEAQRGAGVPACRAQPLDAAGAGPAQPCLPGLRCALRTPQGPAPLRKHDGARCLHL
jgi:hypothetical protein